MRRDLKKFLTLTSLGEVLDFKSPTPKGRRESARKWVQRNGIPKYWRGKAWLVDPADVQKVLRGEQLKSA